MKKNRNKRFLEIPIILILLIIIVIIIVINVLRKEGTNIESQNQVYNTALNSVKENTVTQTNETNISSSEVRILGDNEIIEGLASPNNVNTNNKQYIELSESNYFEYTKQQGGSFRIQDVVHNNDGTITIRGRIYKYVELPVLTKEQFEALQNGKALEILGEKVSKIADNQQSSYNMILNVETQEHEYKMTYFVKQNSNGTASLSSGVEARVADGTDIYMEITLPSDLLCRRYDDEEISLGDYYKQDVHIQDKNRTRLLSSNNEFVFSNGECISISFFE